MDYRVQVTGYRKDDTGFVNIEEANVVVAGGRGLRKAENFRILNDLAKRLEGEVGATRDVVDLGWASYPHQIGLSGKTISSRLYIGAGISGSIQHLAGIKTCETIVSVNTDPEANLHKVADFAIVGDLFEVMPELFRQLGGDKTEQPGTSIGNTGMSAGDSPSAEELGKVPRQTKDSPTPKLLRR